MFKIQQDRRQAKIEKYGMGKNKDVVDPAEYFVAKNKEKTVDYLAMIKDKLQKQKTAAIRRENALEKNKCHERDKIQEAVINLVRWDLKRTGEEIAEVEMQKRWKDKHRKAYIAVLMLTDKIMKDYFKHFMKRRQLVHYQKNLFMIGLLLYMVKAGFFKRRRGL